MILIIDNYDSFTWNLVHLVARAVGDDLRVVRNDEIAARDIGSLRPDGIMISPGPGRPADAGITEEVIRTFGSTIPILGVCLGHQAIGEVYGGRVGYAPVLMHGKTSTVSHCGKGVFDGLPQAFTATRYHSLVVDRDSVPDVLEITAETDDGTVMGLRHRTHPVEGIQFHPESLLTSEGSHLIDNWTALTAQRLHA